jgi:hypothetical protein
MPTVKNIAAMIVVWRMSEPSNPPASMTANA